MTYSYDMLTSDDDVISKSVETAAIVALDKISRDNNFIAFITGYWFWKHFFRLNLKFKLVKSSISYKDRMKFILSN